MNICKKYWTVSSNIFLSLWKLFCQMQTHFLILLSGIPVYGVLTHADKQRSNDRQTQFKNHLGLINTRFKCITNYCTDFDPTESYISTTLPQLDIPVLKLMTQVSFSILSVPDEGYSKNASCALNVYIYVLNSLQWMFHAFFTT